MFGNELVIWKNKIPIKCSVIQFLNSHNVQNLKIHGQIIEVNIVIILIDSMLW